MDGCEKDATCYVNSLQVMRECTSGGVKKKCFRGHLLTMKTTQITNRGYKRCRLCLAIANEKLRNKRRLNQPDVHSTKEITE